MKMMVIWKYQNLLIYTFKPPLIIIFKIEYYDYKETHTSL